MENLDIFPLHSIVFPYQKLSLKIFEPRYLEMIHYCMEEDLPFGICLIEEGQEVGAPAIPHHLGTSVRILTDSVQKISEKLYFITARGERRFEIDQLLQEQPRIRAKIRWIDSEKAKFPGNYEHLRYALERVLENLPESSRWREEIDIPDKEEELIGLVGAVLDGIPEEKQLLLQLPQASFVPALIVLLEEIANRA